MKTLRLATAMLLILLAAADSHAQTPAPGIPRVLLCKGAPTDQACGAQTRAFMDLHHEKVGIPDGYRVQSWYPRPEQWLPDSAPWTMTNLARAALRKVRPQARPAALLEPPAGRVYHGAQLMTYNTAGGPLDGYLGALDSATQPAVRGIFFSVPGTRGPAQALRGLKSFFDDATRIGYIPEVSIFFISDVATDSVFAVSTHYDAIVDSIAALTRQYGRATFLRIGGEFNGAGPGWNGGGYHRGIYTDAFRKVVDMYAARGLRDSIATIWCYEPDAPDDFDAVDPAGPRWYPGDAYVDWFGLDVFDAAHFDPSLPDTVRGAITRKGKSERFLAMARAKGRPVYMSETSAKGVNISADPLDGAADWDAWFVPFFAFIDAHPEIRGYSYIDANWPAGAYPGWGDARIENNADLAAQYRQEMHRSRYIHLPVQVSTPVDLPAAPADPGLTLRPAFPNPFRTGTSITWHSATAAPTRVTVHDALGRVLCTLRDEVLPAGTHSAHLAARSLPPGVYLLRVQAGSRTASVRAVLSR